MRADTPGNLGLRQPFPQQLRSLHPSLFERIAHPAPQRARSLRPFACVSLDVTKNIE